MAARDGERIQGVYHFPCEVCGAATTARRAHARSCSPACAATLRRRDPAGRPGADGVRFYVSQRKLESALDALREAPAEGVELVVGVDAGNSDAGMGRLRVESKGAEGGLIFQLDAPYSPFDQ